MIFLEQLGQLIKIVFTQYTSNFLGESILLIILSIVLVLILIIRTEVCNYFEVKKRDDKLNVLYSLLAEISLPILYFACLRYLSPHFKITR